MEVWIMDDWSREVAVRVFPSVWVEPPGTEAGNRQPLPLMNPPDWCLCVSDMSLSANTAGLSVRLGMDSARGAPQVRGGKAFQPRATEGLFCCQSGRLSRKDPKSCI